MNVTDRKRNIDLPNVPPVCSRINPMASEHPCDELVEQLAPILRCATFKTAQPVVLADQLGQQGGIVRHAVIVESGSVEDRC
jgi:hypothetical protein